MDYTHSGNICIDYNRTSICILIIYWSHLSLRSPLMILLMKTLSFMMTSFLHQKYLALRIVYPNLEYLERRERDIPAHHQDVESLVHRDRPT